ncbi:hypothetical protein TEA_022246 [Camellia sinensis var. sinensis]|uniref:Major facilitator superfamily (MFS) profile domain-containing protein n=1 Tax=Camellia sinensis var. sinensis TaxID=542762 RepID=A0A4S4E2Z4_CAMSN|nr:hypothetical protein TEA_022246 [Camellia sinensis var. sinensis]
MAIAMIISSAKRKKEAREVDKRSQIAQKSLGINGMMFAKKRYAEKAQMKKTLEDAKEVIRNLWGPSEVNKAIEEFQSVNRNDDLESRWLELLEQPHSRVAFIGGALFILQQFAGINGVLYFSSLTFQDVGITSGALASLFVGLTNFAGALGALYLMDKRGRKTLLIGSYLGMAISMFLVVYAISSPIDEELGHNLSILGTVLYIFTFAIGSGPVTGIIIPELSSSRMRGKIMGFSFSVHWVCNFLVGLFFLELVEKFGVAPVYASFGAFSLLSAIFAYNFIIETKGRALGALYLMDKQGRKTLLNGSYLGMAILMFLVDYAISSPIDEELGHNLSILETVLYIFTFAIGSGPVTGIIIPELSSSRMRGKIRGFTFSVHWRRRKERFEKETGLAARDFNLERCALFGGETGSATATATATIECSKRKGFVLLFSSIWKKSDIRFLRSRKPQAILAGVVLKGLITLNGSRVLDLMLHEVPRAK